MIPFIKKVTSGDSEIIGSGTLITYDEKPVDIEFGNEKDTLKITLEFINDESIKGFPIKTSLINQKTLKFTLINFKNTLGVGTNEPIPIGDMDNKKLYLGLKVRSLNKTVKQITVHYTIYQKK